MACSMYFGLIELHAQTHTEPTLGSESISNSENSVKASQRGREALGGVLRST